MHSRSYKLIHRELEKYHKEFREVFPPLRRVYADEDFTWIATVPGLENSLWRGGVFEVAVHFSPGFDDEPPLLYFVTIPFHPNVDPDTGLLGLDYVFDTSGRWPDGRKQSLGHLLLQAQLLLHEPNLDCVLNEEAATTFVYHETAYTTIVRECVTTSRRLFWAPLSGEPPEIPPSSSEGARLLRELYEAVEMQQQSGKTLLTKEEALRRERNAVQVTYDPQYSQLVEERERQQRMAPNITRLNYEDYWATWKGLATSKPSPDATNSYLQRICNNEKLLQVHHGVKFPQIENDLKSRVQQHHTLKYGIPSQKRKQTAAADQNSLSLKLERLNHMKQLFLREKTTASTHRSQHNATGRSFISTDPTAALRPTPSEAHLPPLNHSHHSLNPRESTLASVNSLGPPVLGDSMKTIHQSGTMNATLEEMDSVSFFRTDGAEGIPVEEPSMESMPHNELPTEDVDELLAWTANLS